MNKSPRKFSREARLLKAPQFRAVFRGGRRAQAGPLRARLKENGLEHGRLGLAISRKAAKSAVGRNRVRRQVKESFRRHQHRLAGLDVVVSLYPSADRDGKSLWPQLPRLWNAVAKVHGGESKWSD